MSSLDFISDLFKGINTAFDPLGKGLKSADAFGGLMSELGWAFDKNANINDIRATFAGIENGIAALKAAVEALESGGNFYSHWQCRQQPGSGDILH